MCAGAFCSGFIGHSRPLSAGREVYSQGEKDLPKAQRGLSSSTPGLTLSVARMLMVYHRVYTGYTGRHVQGVPTYQGTQGGIYTGWYTHSPYQGGIYPGISLLRSPGRLSAQRLFSFLREAGGSLRRGSSLLLRVPGGSLRRGSSLSLGRLGGSLRRGSSLFLREARGSLRRGLFSSP